MRTSLEKGKQEDESERLGGETLKRRKKRAAAALLLLPSPAFIIFSLPSSPALPLLFLFSFLAAEEETRVCSKSISQSSLSLSLSRTKKSLSLSLSLSLSQKKNASKAPLEKSHLFNARYVPFSDVASGANLKSCKEAYDLDEVLYRPRRSGSCPGSPTTTSCRCSRATRTCSGPSGSAATSAG
jgi:hypothetical protein